MVSYLLSLSIVLSYVHSQVYFNEAHASITCSQSSCQIACDQAYGCNNLTIDASQSNTLTIICSAANSCQTMTITSSGQISTEINCTSLQSCLLAQFNVNNSPTVDLNCDYNSTIYSNGACGYATLNSSLSTNVNIDCANGYSCYQTKIYCPSSDGNNQCNVTCSNAPFSCATMDIFVADNRRVNLDCSISALPCSNVDIYCGITTSSPKSDLIHARAIGWYCSNINYGCCPFYEAEINCGSSNCTVDCVTTDCSRYFIDGTAAGTTSLTVDCDATNGGCAGATIVCQEGVQCSVNCQDANSCNGAKIIGSSAYWLNLYCAGDGACRDINVYCPYDGSSVCNIDCSSGDLYVCYNMDIIVGNTFKNNYLSLLCPNTNDNYSCSALFSCNYVPDNGLSCTGCNTDFKIPTSLIFNSDNNEYDCYDVTLSYCCPWGENATTVVTTPDTTRVTIDTSTTTAATTGGTTIGTITNTTKVSASATKTNTTANTSVDTSPTANNCATYRVYEIFIFLMFCLYC